MNQLENDSENTNDRVKVLEYKSIDIEACSRRRRNNLVFRGIAELYSHENSEELLTNFIEEHLGIHTQYIQINKAHGVGKTDRKCLDQ